MHLACQEGLSENVQLLLELDVNVNMKDDRGQTPLFIAVRQGYNSIVELLLKWGADPNIPTNGGENCYYITRNVNTLNLLIRFDGRHGWGCAVGLGLHQFRHTFSDEEEKSLKITPMISYSTAMAETFPKFELKPAHGECSEELVEHWVSISSHTSVFIRLISH